MEIAHLSGLAATDWTWAVKLGDLDCDGWLDLYVTNGMSGDYLNPDLRAALGTGGGTVVKNPRPKKISTWPFATRRGLGLSRASVKRGASNGSQ